MIACRIVLFDATRGMLLISSLFVCVRRVLCVVVGVLFVDFVCDTHIAQVDVVDGWLSLSMSLSLSCEM